MKHAPLLEIKNLIKYYKGKAEPAVDDISLSVNYNEIFGLLGPNGAGKTTTISVLSSLLKPTSGSVLIEGKDLYKNLQEVKRLIGIVPQEIALYDKLSASENLRYFGKLQGMSTPDLEKRIDSLLGRLDLLNFSKIKVKNFSGGMKRRINLIAGILHRPKLLILDEPTSGVDVQTRNIIREFLLELRDEHTSIIYTSHQMEDAERLCDRICILDYGKILQTASPDQLIREHAQCNTLEEVFIALTGRNMRDS